MVGVVAPLIALAAALAAIVFGCAPDAVPPRHLVLVTLDTLRADRLGSYGYPRETTPQLDRLARRAVRFDDAIAQSIATPPSHASILTGLNPPAHGLRHLVGERLAPEQVTLAEILRDAGFSTAAFVSGLPLRRAVGLDQGFEFYDDTLTTPRERPAGATNQRVSAWLAGWHGERLFLWVHYFDPHTPYLAPAVWRERFHPSYVGPRDLIPPRNANPRTGKPELAVRTGVPRMADLYDAEVAYTDHAVGELLTLLEQRGILSEAVVAVVADHGECLGERGYFFGHWDVYRETARVPMLLANPRGRGAGREVKATVRTTDLLPTLLAWLEVRAPNGLDGEDLTPLIEGREAQPRTAYTEQTHSFLSWAVREGPYLLVAYDFSPGGDLSGALLYQRRADGTLVALPAGTAAVERARLEAALREQADPPNRAVPQPLAVPDAVRESLRALGYSAD